MFGYAVDVQAGTPRAWTVIGTVSLVLGSIFLYPGGPRPAWQASAAGSRGSRVFQKPIYI